MKRALELTRKHKQFEGYNYYYRHFSNLCQSFMNFAVYLPPQARQRKLPAVYFLSGLTCSEEIFMTEAQAQFYAKRHELILVVPDTSPRHTGIPGEDDSYDLGSGASFYVDATQVKWSKHYQMDSYITQELRQLVEQELPVSTSRRGISGHSMGGHGALTLGLRNQGLYQSISAFAPICAPSKSPWGIKAFSEYLGPDRTLWKKYDAHDLVQTLSCKVPILIDQGTEDEFLEKELCTDEFEQTVKAIEAPVTLRRQNGYDHSYFFVSTFIDDHLAFHSKYLNH